MEEQKVQRERGGEQEEGNPRKKRRRRQYERKVDWGLGKLTLETLEREKWLKSGEKNTTKDILKLKQTILKIMTGTEVIIRNNPREILEKALGRL